VLTRDRQARGVRVTMWTLNSRQEVRDHDLKAPKPYDKKTELRSKA
jgi:hypothetical protein